jgi:hypothetical protein
VRREAPNPRRKAANKSNRERPIFFQERLQQLLIKKGEISTG